MIEIGSGFAAVWLPINSVVIVYLGGVAIALLTIDARGPARLGLALLWPVGPLAFVVTITILLAASLIAFPIVGVVVVSIALIAAVAWGIGL